MIASKTNVSQISVNVTSNAALPLNKTTSSRQDLDSRTASRKVVDLSLDDSKRSIESWPPLRITSDDDTLPHIPLIAIRPTSWPPIGPLLSTDRKESKEQKKSPSPSMAVTTVKPAIISYSKLLLGQVWPALPRTTGTVKVNLAFVQKMPTKPKAQASAVKLGQPSATKASWKTRQQIRTTNRGASQSSRRLESKMLEQACKTVIIFRRSNTN